MFIYRWSFFLFFYFSSLRCPHTHTHIRHMVWHNLLLVRKQLASSSQTSVGGRRKRDQINQLDQSFFKQKNLIAAAVAWLNVFRNFIIQIDRKYTHIHRRIVWPWMIVAQIRFNVLLVCWVDFWIVPAFSRSFFVIGHSQFGSVRNPDLLFYFFLQKIFSWEYPLW